MIKTDWFHRILLEKIPLGADRFRNITRPKYKKIKKKIIRVSQISFCKS